MANRGMPLGGNQMELTIWFPVRQQLEYEQKDLWEILLAEYYPDFRKRPGGERNIFSKRNGHN